MIYFMRKTVRKIHLWLGLASGIVLSILGLTGSFYVFEPEISRVFTEEYHTQKEASLFDNDVELVTFIELQTGKKLESLQWPQRGRDTYMFKPFDDEKFHFFDQTTGKIIWASEIPAEAFFRFILDLHTTLTLGDAGYVVTAVSSLIFALFMLSTGVYLWWPRVKGRLKSSFKIKWYAGKKRINYDLHNVTGFYFFLPLLLMGITGGSFYFYDEAQWVLDKFTCTESSSPAIWGNHFSDTLQTGKRPLTIREALVEMDKYNQDYYKRNLWMTNEPDGTLSFAYQKFNHVHAGPDSRIFLQVERYTGEILAEQNPQKETGGAYILTNWLLPVHFGEFGGLITRILWFIGGFIPALLTYTGVKIWLGRRKKSTKKRLRKSQKGLNKPKTVVS
jgi:uncharacterized iron-regulated membrane protein